MQKPEISSQYSHAAVKMVSVIKQQLMPNETRESRRIRLFLHIFMGGGGSTSKKGGFLSGSFIS